MQKGDVKALELKVQEDDLLKQFVGLLDYDTRADFTSQGFRKMIYSSSL